MLTTHVPQITGPNQSGPNASVELSPEFRAALTARGVDLDTVHTESDGSITIESSDGDTIHVGEEPFYADPDRTWFTARLVTADREVYIYEGGKLSQLVDALASAVS